MVLLPPADEGLVALQPHQGLGPVDPGAQERRDGRRVARAGEVEQGRLGGGLRVVLLLVHAVTLAAGPDDASVFIAPDVYLALPAGEGAGGELLDESFIMTAESLEDRNKGAEAGGGDHVGGVLAGLQEDGHDDPCDLRAAVAVEPECAADVLHDLHLRAAGVREADRLDTPRAGDVDALPEDPHRGEERAVYPAAGRVDAVGELAQDLASFGYEVVAAQPRRPDPVRRHVAAGLELVELRVDRRRGEPVRGCQVLVRGVVDVQLRGRLRQLLRERRGLFHLLVESHHGAQIPRGGVFQERGLQERQAPAPLRLFRFTEGGGGVADLQHVDLEPGEDAALDGLRQPEFVDPLAVRPVRIAGHRRDRQLLAVLAPLRPR